MTSSHISHKLAKGKNLWLYPYGLSIIVLLSILCFQLFDNANAKQSLTTTSHTPSLTQKAQPVADPGVTTQIFLPFVTQAVDNTSLTEEQPPQPIAASAVDTNYVGNSGIHPPTANNHTFVADTGGHLDQYLGRIDTANGRLTFPIAINAPVIEPFQVGSDGFPTAQAFVSLVDQQILPQYALLTLQVYDIDDELTLSCPQIDHIYVNGWQINDIKQGIPAVLRGGNEKWHIWTTIFPAYMLKYPTSPGINGQLPVAVSNEIAIAVDTACNPPHWKVEVDWVTISIESSRNYPLLFVHGWTGNVNTFSEFAQFAEEQGIYTYTANLNFGIEPLPLSISLLKQEIEEIQTKYNADKVNLITHSRGGIFTRAALREWPYLAGSIQSYVTLSTPHHGVDAPESILSNDIAGPFDRCTPPSGPPPTGYQGDPDEYRNKCQVAAEGLRKDQMLAYNYGNKCRLERSIVQNTPLDNGTIQEEWLDCYPQWIYGAEDEVRAYTIVGGSWDVQNTSATFPWVAQRMGEDPFPEHAWVDGYFPLYDHVSITKDREVYDYVMDLIYSEPPLNNSQAAQVNHVADLNATNEPVLPGTGAQTLFLQAGELVANQVLTFMIPLESVTAVDFKVLANSALSITLRTPVGQLIDPSIADADPQITYLSEAGSNNTTSVWRYTYQVQNPATGPWEVQLTSLNAAQFVVHTEITSSVRLVASANAGAYHPGETILVQAGLVDDNRLQSGATITGTALLPGNTALPLTFYDDGTHGDAVANNHFFTAQLTAPPLNGRARITLQATKGNTVRLTEVGFTVAAQNATFQSVVNETPVDSNGNGYYDTLNLMVALNVQATGDYIVQGILTDSNGNLVAPATYSTIDAETPLAAGVQAVTLQFAGKTLREAGANGPYSLKQVQINYYDPTAYESFTVDTAENVYTTNSYTTNQFEGELLRVTGSSDGVEDANGDGIYDSLKISVTLDVLLPGAYNWIGELVDATGAHVTGASGSGQLNSQTPAVFTFGGWQLINAGLNGPYRLTNVYVTKTTDKVFVQYFDDLHTTAAYQTSQFGSLPLLLTNVQQQTFDGNNNGLYDALIVTSTVTALDYEGEYTWRGRLVAPNGIEVAVTSGGGDLFEGKKLRFVFLSPTIRNAGINGPYTIRDVTLTSTAMPTITMAYPILGVTSAYPASQFDDWQSSITAHTITPVDVDGNNLYDRLEFSTTVALPWPGLYEISFALTTQDGSMGPSFTNMKSYLGPTPELLQFSASAIINAGLDGPYVLKLTDLLYLPIAGQATPLNIMHNITTTPPYQLGQFQGFPILPPPAAPVLSQPVNDDNDGNYTVEWSPITGTVSYELQERQGALLLNPYITIYTGAAPSFAVTERQSEIYYYRVRTKRGLQNSNWSNFVKVTVAAATPTPSLTPTPTVTPLPTNTPTPTATPLSPTDTPTPGSAPTDTPIPTATATPAPGDTPTATPTPGDPPTPTATATPGSGSATMIYISSYGNGTIGGIAFNDEDIIAYNMTTGAWSLIFDGSDVGVTASVDALQVESDGSLLLSFFVDATIAGFGTVADEDIVRFTPTSLGDATAGSIAWFFDGSDVELDTDDEDIDTLTRLPDGRLVIGAAGSFNAGGVSGVAHDLFLFTPTSLGETTSGSWQLYFDGSDVGLSGTNEDLWGVELAPNGDLYLNAQYAYAVPGFSGDGDDILRCTPGTLGDTTSCTYSLYWNGDSYGVGSYWLDALAISDVALIGSANAERTAEESAAPRSQVYLPLINR